VAVRRRILYTTVTLLVLTQPLSTTTTLLVDGGREV
jgi:hypothetical protein